MDRIVLEILWNRLIGVVNEQAAALIRTSFTSIVRDAGDLSAAVFDRRGRMIAQAVTGTPGHINSMATGVTHFLAAHPLDTLRPGDVLITNDPWKTASQLNDLTVVTPVFKNGRAVALFGCCCHALDIGGRGLSADAREVFEEGLFIPIVKLYDAGRPAQPVFDILKANVRAPEEVLGDLHSQVVGNQVGARQLLAFMDEFGLDDIETLSDAIVERTEAAMRESVAALPDGEYRNALVIDGFDAPIALKVAVRVAGDALSVDYAGSAGAVDRGINVAFNYTAAYTTYGLKCAISPDVPNNEGSFRPIAIRAPEGSILNALPPAAVGGRHLVGHFLPALLFGALAETLPERIMAPGADGLWNTQIFGEDPATGRPYTYLWFASGGTGATPAKDGLSATAFPSGVAGVPVEVIETLAPIVIGRRELRTDSGGAGRSRGGLGQSWDIAVQGSRPFGFSGLYERIRNPAPGLQGGRAGAAGAIAAHGAPAPRPKTRAQLPAGTEITIELPGGGGFGPPWERDPERVRDDALDGYVSVAKARADYGVALDPETLALDAAETEKLRAAMRAGK